MAGLQDVQVVTSEISNLSSVRVRLQIAGEFNGDLSVYIRHAHAVGTNHCVLLNRSGRSSTKSLGYSDAGFDVLFDDFAANGNIHVYQSVTNLPARSPLSGAWRPDGRSTDPSEVMESQLPLTWLTSFTGVPASGEWTLFVADVDSGGTNFLLGWELELIGDTAFVGIPEQTAYVLVPLVLTNRIADSNRFSGTLTFGLGPGAPTGARVNPTTGVFRWTPTREQARSLNVISVWVTDNSWPPVRATNTFSVTVEDYVELVLGQAVLRSGQTGSIPLTLRTSTSVTNVQALVQTPEARLANLTLVQWAPELARATVQPQALNAWQMEFAASPGQVLQATQVLGWLQFLAVSNSAIVPLVASNLVAFRAEGPAVLRTFSSPGRVVIVEREPVLQALPPSNGLHNLVLYGIPGHGYDILAKPVLVSPDAWLPVGQATVPNDSLWILIQGLTNSSSGPANFYRARDQTGD